MREIKHLLRKNYIDRLSGLTYRGVAIPVDDEYLTKTAAQLNIGNSTGVQAYVLIQNQTTNDDSPKCGIIQNSTLQIHIYTEFNPNSGNYAHADLIGDAILQILMPGSSKQIAFDINGYQVVRAWEENSMQLSEETPNKRIFRNILVLNHTIAQLTT